MSDRVRYWDPDGKFDGAVLKWYVHWCLEVSFHQHALGSFILFCRRSGVLLISDLHPEELAEMQLAMQEIELVLRGHPFFRADHFNYLQMGNELHLLHFHGIPRYQSPRVFFGKRWVDHAWGHPPAWTKELSPIALVVTLGMELRKHLGV